MTIWVEILSRHGQVTSRFRCAGPTVRIGRSYRNDVVIDDPAVAAEHLLVTHSGDNAVTIATASDTAIDAGAFRLAGKHHRDATVDGDAVIQIGNSWLRLRDETYPVTMIPVMARRPFPVFGVALLAIVALAVFGLDIWLDETSETRIAHYIEVLVGLVGIVVVWTSLWALSSRLFAGQSRFMQHLAIALGGIVAFLLIPGAIRDLAFALASRMIDDVAPITVWCVLAVICFLHLQTIAPTRVVLKASIAAALAVTGIALQLAYDEDPSRVALQPLVVQKMLPPEFRLARIKSEDQFFAQVADLRKALDADRPVTAPTTTP